MTNPPEESYWDEVVTNTECRFVKSVAEGTLSVLGAPGCLDPEEGIPGEMPEAAPLIDPAPLTDFAVLLKVSDFFRPDPPADAPAVFFLFGVLSPEGFPLAAPPLRPDPPAAAKSEEPPFEGSYNIAPLPPGGLPDTVPKPLRPPRVNGPLTLC